ncbi:lipopolysaccharide biosynthesis protein [Enterococcus sp. RIT-PI-f]|uniref:lipopolysaccharide biosynthesis protein n=1 Tax=Enterococcus sp. RIT-PI-f TaxID=1690244 RepID=UPI0006B8976A|nr:hypothetical protein [Enterococcus sp. RIT-PI-f]KPG74156.1 hypothetical protein AEQ18_00415 [Enterococcus sp. RIT-PI-f]
MFKRKKNLFDILANIGSFGIYILAQQIILMPFLAKISSNSDFSFYMVFLTIFNILSTIIGEDLGNTRIMNISNNRIYREKKYFYLLGVLSLSVFPICIFWISIFFEKFLHFTVLISVIILIGILRFYLMSVFRSAEKYMFIFLSNSTYLFSVIICILFFDIVDNPLVIFLIGETIASIILIILIPFNRDNLFVSNNSEVNRSIRDGVFLKDFFTISFSSLLLNLAVYMDRFTIIPLVGINSVNQYYSATSMSKLLSMLVNPFSNWFFVRISKTSHSNLIHFEKRLSQLTLIGLFVFTFLSGLFSLLGVLILYPSSFSGIVYLLVPVSIATASSLITSILKPIALIKNKSAVLLKSNFLYASIFLLLAFLLSPSMGVIGFAYANCIGRLIQLYINLINVKGNKNGD